MIEGVKTKQLRVIPDERGRLTEMLRADDELFIKFGQCYMTTTYPGVVKAWHYHKIQTDNFVVITGMFKVALFDTRDHSSTKGKINEFFIGDFNPMLLQIPPGVYHGWKCISERDGVVVNVSTETYDYKEPDEYRLPFDTDEIPYDWGIKMG
jgi:dTDP-4-dehydrorhamnose 3,5-epimerase